MKRLRNVEATKVEALATKTTTMAKKKGKKPVQKVKEEMKHVTGDGGEEFSPVTAAENLLDWEEWPWLRGGVDEQMSWGSIWLPFWDMEYMGEAFREMFSDVVWDDDIWNLMSINNIPNP